MQDRPSALELIRGIYLFLERDVVPELKDPLRFHTLVAANLLKIIEREILSEPGNRFREAERLGKLLSKEPASGGSSGDLEREIQALNEELCARIRIGEADEGLWHQEVMDHVRKTLLEKLEIANPRMVKRAQERY